MGTWRWSSILLAAVGEWVGEYSSAETGRVGSIVFTLAAGRDTAAGDVMMVPANIEPATTFDGLIKGNKLEGTFVSYLELSGKRRTGKWIVNRKKAN